MTELLRRNRRSFEVRALSDALPACPGLRLPPWGAVGEVLLALSGETPEALLEVGLCLC